jgi:hypothetical protein
MSNKLSFNNIFIPRRIDKIEEKERAKIQKILQQEIIEGDLDLYEIKWIEDLGNVKEVKGDLDLCGSSIKSLGKLEYVDGDLWLSYTPIQSLGNLIKRVEGSLYLAYSSIQSLGKLEYVGGDLYFKNTPLSELPRKELNKILSKIEIEGEVYVE